MSRSKDGVFDFVVERDGQKVELSDVHFDTEQQDGITLIKYDFVIIGEKRLHSRRPLCVWFGSACLTLSRGVTVCRSLPGPSVR